MKKLIFLLAVLILFEGALCAQLPDTPAGRQFSAWKKAQDSGDRATIQDFIDKYMAWGRVEQELTIHNQSDGFDVKNVEASSDTRLVVLAQERGLSHLSCRITFGVASAEPHEVTGIMIQPLEPPPELPVPNMSEDEIITALRARVEKDTAADRFAGTVILAKGGKVLFSGAYGFADREKKIANSLDTRFRIGSMNKMFTAVSILQLVQAGKINLSDPLGKYVTDYPNRDVATKVTIHQLLTHTGGTGDIFGPEFDAHRLALRTLDDYVALYGKRSPLFEPGSDWAYSNYGMLLLGVVIERASGQSYFDYVAEHIYKPAGMTLSGSEPESRAVSARSIGYMRDQGGAWIPNTDTLPYRGTSAGGGYSTVGDLVKFADALMGHRLLNAQFTELLITGKAGPDGSGIYAYGFEDGRKDGAGAVGHGGGAPGMNGDLKIYPSSGYVVAVLSNIDPPAAQMISGFLDARLTRAVVRRADALDDTIIKLMAEHHIPGLSLAIIQNGTIIKAKGYGVVEEGGATPVTTDTLFQAGSVSKSVAALGALALVDAGKLSLDTNVNGALKTWHVPDNAFTKENKVTLRRLLSHSASLTVHGFPGYAVGVSRPTLVQILDGEKPANTEAVRVDQTPGSQWRYSGGGYMVMQQLLVDITGQSFPDFMRTQVLVPLEMRASSFEQPLPPDRAALAASGHYPGKTLSVVPGRRHIYPEMAAAGLWTTPSDLARFAIALQGTFAGRIHPVISSAMAAQMMSVQKGNDGLGVFLAGDGATRRFEHGGRNEGFDTEMTAYLESGQGAVIMINTNDNSSTVAEIMEKIAEVYDWKNYPRMAANPEPELTASIEDKEPEVTQRLKRVMEQLRSGELNHDWFTTKFVESFSPLQSRVAAEVQTFGELKSISLIERKNADGHRSYRYRMVYVNKTVVILYSYNKDGKIEGLFFLPK